MKTKYLFYSLAMAGMFAACSQEELVETPVVKDNVADRPVAGVVEFSTEGVESRYNYESNEYEIGDVFGLYLMDNFDKNGKADWFDANRKIYASTVGTCDAEHDDANSTPWKYQNHWFGMYSFTNSIQSNYPFRYVSEGGENVWKNDAKLVEGNYFAMYPQNEKALNRRELWHAIKPSLDLKVVKSNNANGNKYQNVENQFWLGYKQIYRDATASAEGVMKLDVNMKAAMVALKFYINNSSNADVTLDKIVIKDKTGDALPTLAYIKPASYTDRGVLPADASTHHVEAGWVIADNSKAGQQYCSNIYENYGLYDEAKTWTRNAVYNLVKWTVPGEEEKIPYGLDEADQVPAYEYSFSFPADTKIKGLGRGGQVVYAYVTIPALTSEIYNDLSVAIYGWEEITDKTPAYGVLVPNNNQEADKNNYSFLLKDVLAKENIAEEGSYYRSIDVIFDNVAWSWKDAGEAITPSSTQNMEDLILNGLSKTVGDFTITVAPDANGVELTSEFLAQLKFISAKEPRDIKVIFDGERGGKVEFNDDNTLLSSVYTTETNKTVEFEYINGIELYNHAEQTITDNNTIGAGASIINEGDGVLNVVYTNPLGSGTINGNVTNNGEMKIYSSTVADVTNYGMLTLSGAKVTNLTNKDSGVVDVTGSSEVTYLNNNGGDHTCGTCTARPTLNVKAGTLTSTKLFNGGNGAGAIMKVAAGATVNATAISNYNHTESNVQKIELENKGTIKGGTLGNGGTVDNYGQIQSLVENKGVVNAWAGKINNLKNTEANGTLNALSESIEVIMNGESQGKIVYTGVVAQYVQKNGADKAIFRTTEDMEIMGLIEKMSSTGSKTLMIGHNLDLNFDNTVQSNVDVVTKFRNNLVTDVVVEGNIHLSGEMGRTYTAFRNAEFQINDDCTMYVDGIIVVEIANLTFNVYQTGAVWVGSGATLNIDGITYNNQKITSSNLTIKGGTTGTSSGSTNDDM